MPVHNALPYLDEAVESILAQTFADFEFVILDDASTDGSTERLRQWAARDERIRLIEEPANLGPALSSDKVARAAAAPLIARMDADDISSPDRLAEQVAILADHADVGLVGSLCELITTDGRQVRGPEEWRLARNSAMAPFPHGAMTFRTELFRRVGGYRPACVFWEDQDLAVRLAAVSRVLVIPRPLYLVRQSSTSTRAVSALDRLEQSFDLMFRSMDRLRGKQEYDSLLKAGAERNEKIDPRALISSGSVILWAGGRPRLFRRMLSRARLGLSRRSIAAIVWSGWASASPATLRLFLDSLHRLRNARAGLDPRTPVEWSPAGR